LPVFSLEEGWGWLLQLLQLNLVLILKLLLDPSPMFPVFFNSQSELVVWDNVAVVKWRTSLGTHVVIQ